MLESLNFTFIILLWPLCLFLIGMILLQGGAGDLSSAFGGGGQLDSTLGVGAGRKMSKVTGWMALAFLVIVAVLAIPHGTVGSAKQRAETVGIPSGAAVMTGDAPIKAPVDGTGIPGAGAAVPADVTPGDAAEPTDAAVPVDPAVVPTDGAPAAEAAPAPEVDPAAEAAPAPAAQPAPGKPASTIRIDE